MIEQQLPDSRNKNQDRQFSKLPPQLKIYNRNFYLRNAREQALQQQITRQIHQLSQKPKLTPNSYMILVQKLEQKLEQIYHKHLQETDDINFQHFQLILNEMGKFQQITKQEDLLELEILSTQLWLILVNYNLQVSSIPKNILTSLIHILFCPYTLKHPEMVSLFEHAFPNLEQQRLKYIKKYPQCQEQVINITQLVRLWLKIKRTFSLLTNGVAKERTSLIGKSTLTFKPEINPKSRVIADRSLQKYLSHNKLDNIKESKLNQLSGYISGGQELSYHEILYKRGLQKQQILKTIRQQTPIVQNQKTLTTEQTKKLVENLYIIKEKRQDLDYSKIKEQQQLKKCTFQPNTIQYHKRNVVPSVKNYEKQIERMQKGRKDKQKLKEAYDNLGKVKPKSTGPPSFVERQKPRLILQIKLGEQIVKLNLKGDEQAKIAAKKFVFKHGLNQSMQEVLQSIIEQQLEALQY